MKGAVRKAGAFMTAGAPRICRRRAAAVPSHPCAWRHKDWSAPSKSLAGPPPLAGSDTRRCLHVGRDACDLQVERLPPHHEGVRWVLHLQLVDVPARGTC